MVEPSGDFVLILSCPDRPGIVHDVSGFLAKQAATSSRASSSATRSTGRFFMRVDFEIPGPAIADELRVEFAPVAAKFGMDYELWTAAAPYRTLIMVSKHLHCLNDLLFRWSDRNAADRDPGRGVQPPRLPEALRRRTDSRSTTSR